MSIIQISKIQQRSGDLVDLPQLDEAEFGFASDEKRLFIGTTSNNIENVEVLTAYSDIAFSQIDGAVGNLNINSNVANGEVLVFDGTNWVNRGGDTGGYINLGEISNVSILGGGVGYQIVTDGVGNLSWSPKGFLELPIMNISQANPGRITLVEPYPLTSATQVTINNVQSAPTGFTVLNANVFYLKSVAGTTQEYDLYLDTSLLNPYNTSAITPAYPFTAATSTSSTTDEIVVTSSAPFAVNQSVIFEGTLGTSGIVANTVYYVYSKPDSTHIKIATSGDGNVSNVVQLTTDTIVANVFCSTAIAIVDLIGGGSGTAGGVNTQVQFNYNSSFAGDAGLTYDYTTTKLTANNFVVSTLATIANLKVNTNANIVGNANVGNLGFGTGIITGTGNITGGNIQGKSLTITGAATGNSNVSTIIGNQLGFKVLTATYTDNVAAGSSTIANAAIHAIATPTLAATNTLVTATNAATFYIQSAPTAGTNMTITNPYALYVAGGNSYFNGGISVTGTSNLGSNTNVKITGGTSGQYLQTTDGAGTLSWVTIPVGSGIVNGTSNISIPTTNGNVNTSVGGTANVLVVTTTGANITGTANVSGNISTSANITANNFIISNVTTGISAAGTNQGSATALTRAINVVSTVAAGANGVVMPTAVAGMNVIIINTSATALNVYPASSAAIDALALNAAFSLSAGAKLQFIATSTTQWYTLNATYL